MINLSTILGLARAEARLARRLVRYWVFVVLALLLSALQFLQFYFIHRGLSWASASAATANPRYFIGNFGGLFMIVFFIGLVFLAFDVRAREKRDRIDEVVDALPCSNLEILLAKALGIFFAAWVPAVLVMVTLVIVAWLIGSPIETYSIFSLLLLMVVPAYTFTIGIVFLLTLAVRHRLVAAIVSLAVMALLFIAGIWWVPFYLTPYTDMTGGYAVNFPSDLVPGLTNFVGLLQRIGYLLAGLGLIFFGAAIHPRKDDSSRGLLTLGGAILLLVAVGLCSVQSRTWINEIDERRNWNEVHQSRRDGPTPEIRQVTGEVRIDPGRHLAMNLGVTIGAPRDVALDSALFTLNPGLEVGEVRDAAGSTLEFTHEDGLLEIDLPAVLQPGDETELALAIEGRPDPNFAYLDAPVEMLSLNPSDAQIYILGFESIVFDRRYVALLPGVRWLPAAGTESGRDDPQARARDFYALDLTVDLPEGWLVAGPGRRLDAEGPTEAGRVRFRYAPDAPVPEVALVAAPFESRSTEIEGITLEVLVHPKHLANVEFFEDAAGEIDEWLTERLGEVADLGLGYPYGALTMVESPTTLRGFGGGWRMDSTLIQPATILMRESTFPTANFKARDSRFQQARDQEGGVARVKRQALERFFENDLNGGNPFVAAARSFFTFQTAGAGPEGLPLDYVFENLTSELVTLRRGFFSVHFFDQDFAQDFMMAGQSMRDPDRVSDNYSEVLIHRIVSTNKVWDTVVDVSLLELDPAEDPERAINVLSLKGGAMAKSMLDELGREKTGQFLAALREEHLGEVYTREGVVAAGQTVGEDLAGWLDLWIDQTDLPGFKLGDVRYHRLADGEDGSMQYQLLATVRNGEDAPGLVRLEYRIEEENRFGSWEKADPVSIPGFGAVEVGLVTSNPLRVARVAPYLALNRDPFNVPLPQLDQEKIVEEEPFVGTREIEWAPEETAAIVVDDLDEGFSVEESEDRSLFRFGGRGSDDEDLDNGLPIATEGLSSTRWSRMTSADAFGKYRRTMAVVRAGEGQRSAAFRTELPGGGAWELELYLPGVRSGARRRTAREPGTWKLTIEDDAGTQEVEFDATAGERGWNSLGSFEIGPGEVVVRLSDETDGDYIEADAIRLTPTSEEPQGTIAAVTKGGR
jgi:ABC-type transport system involved in multi-copper enzyme maturation permease subunit